MPQANSLTAEDVMRTKLVSLRPDTDVMDAMHLLARHRVSGAPVVDVRGNLVGILSERDGLHSVLAGCYLGACGCGPVADFMSTDVMCVDTGTSLLEIAQMFDRTKYRRFPVVDENHVVGIVTRRDVLHVLMDMA